MAKPYWCLAKVEGNRERRAQFFIELLTHHQTYCPRFVDERRSKSIRPVYPGYVFVYLHDCQFAFLKSTPHVIGPVGFGAKPPSLVPERIIMDMKRRETDQGLLPFITNRFRRGQKVKVVYGALAGQMGFYEGYVRSDHHRIIMDILGQAVKTDLPYSMLDAAA